jgi:hypothetical protein
MPLVLALTHHYPGKIRPQSLAYTFLITILL